MNGAFLKVRRNGRSRLIYSKAVQENHGIFQLLKRVGLNIYDRYDYICPSKQVSQSGMMNSVGTGGVSISWN